MAEGDGGRAEEEGEEGAGGRGRGQARAKRVRGRQAKGGGRSEHSEGAPVGWRGREEWGSVQYCVGRGTEGEGLKAEGY